MRSWRRRFARGGSADAAPKSAAARSPAPPRRTSRPGEAKSSRRRALSRGFHLLEAREMMTADSLTQGVYDAGAAYIAPIWFEQLSTSASSASGLSALENSVSKLDWNNASIDVYSNEWILQLGRDAIDQIGQVSDVAALLAPAGFGFEVIGGLGMTGQVLVRALDATSLDVSDWLGAQDWLAYYEPNAVLPLSATPNDPSYSQLWGLNNTGQTGGTFDSDIDAPEAWNVTTGSSSIVVGLIDTGVDYTHPDLAANIWTNPGEIAGNGIDDDHNGFVDDVHGYDFVNNDGDPMDDNGHGTHCAGTIGATGDNGQGVVGVAWDTSIMALKFLSGSGSGSISDAVRALNYATMMRQMYGVDVRLTSNSWGGGGYSQAMYDAIAASGQAGMLFVAAAGNNASNNDATANYPSNYNLANVIAVAATDQYDNLASFSNYGATTVDLAAPGVNIYSTKPGGGYQYMSGTSMATPHVSGAIALLWSANGDATAAEIRAALLGGVDEVASLDGKVTTGGRLNIRGSLDLLGMQVVGSTPTAGSTIGSRLTQFTVDFSENFDAASLQAGDFTVNGIAATSFSVVDANTITFRFNTSPITAEGAQTMRIAEGAIQDAGGGAIHAWQSTFYYDQVALGVVAATPSEGQTLSQIPTSITLTFNEAVAASSIGIGDLVLSAGTVTAATLVNATTVRYTVNLAGVEGPVTYSLASGALADAHGTPSAAFVGHFTIDDPTITRYLATGLPKNIPDQSKLVSTITIAAGGTIRDLDVELDITHTWDEDLDIVLIAPDGTRVTLFNDVGSSGHNFTGTILDDEASTSISAGAAPFSGRFRPQSLLSALDGKSITGVWTLEITDDYQYDTGTLLAWGLRVTANQAPQIAAIADQTLSHNADQLVLPLSISDAEGQAITVSAQVVSRAYEADQRLGLYAEPARVSANYYYNSNGLQEKWLAGSGNKYYYLLPDGRLYQWQGSMSGNPVVATVDPSCWADPSKLCNAASPAALPVQLSYNAGTGKLTIDPAAGFVGEFDVRITASDGVDASQSTFHVSVVNAAPTLAAIPAQTMSARQDTLSFQTSVTNTDGDPLSYSVSATGVTNAAAVEADQRLGLTADSTRVNRNYYYNSNGLQEKWLAGSGNKYYYLLPDGRLYQWQGGMSGNPVVATVDPSCWADPSKLWNAQLETIAVAATVDAAGRVTINPPDGFVGQVRGSVSVSDGAATATQSFTVDVVNAVPTLAPIAAVTAARNTSAIEFDTQVTNLDNDPLSYGVSAEAVVNSHALSVDAQYGLSADSSRVAANYYYNSNGRQEKWLAGSGNKYYYLLPDGRLYQWQGSFAGSTLVATVDSSLWTDPSKLWNAQPLTVEIGATVDANGHVTLTPPEGFSGTIRGYATVSDGASTSRQAFTVNVVNQSPTLASVPNQTVSAAAVSTTLQLDATDPDGDSLVYFTSTTTTGSTHAYAVDQQFGLTADSTRVNRNYYYNSNGLQEKWLAGSGNKFYYLLPDGRLYQWQGSMSGNPVVATVDPSCWADPSKLWNAPSGASQVSAAVDATGRVTVAAPSDFSGAIDILASVSDGLAFATQQIRVNVTAAQGTAASLAVDSTGGATSLSSAGLTSATNTAATNTAAAVGSSSLAAASLDSALRASGWGDRAGWPLSATLAESVFAHRANAEVGLADLNAPLASPRDWAVPNIAAPQEKAVRELASNWAATDALESVASPDGLRDDRCSMVGFAADHPWLEDTLGPSSYSEAADAVFEQIDATDSDAPSWDADE